MGLKSRVASMQRGTKLRDPRPFVRSSNYGGRKPSQRMEDDLHLGASHEARASLLEGLEPKIRIWSRGGFRKPAEVCRLLNKFGHRTATGDQWSPRLVWFLLSEIIKFRQAAASRPPSNFPKVARSQLSKSLNMPSTELSVAEMIRRMEALRDLFTKKPRSPF
jgi:hypothetical protein